MLAQDPKNGETIDSTEGSIFEGIRGMSWVLVPEDSKRAERFQLLVRA